MQASFECRREGEGVVHLHCIASSACEQVVWMWRDEKACFASHEPQAQLPVTTNPIGQLLTIMAWPKIEQMNEATSIKTGTAERLTCGSQQPIAIHDL
ncbi:hypothetical protein VTL71DRAFT_264, partial [Oculimacula yallundae]